ncbi:50S ribosomal protein L9 [Mycoplasmopsis fermentans]|uniref:50S ribosomal protein L9 n=1 Tax=Mycoplasmopsis fermentans TaxID=2115 RepID=UPI0001E32F69|nr:50S ribosomal protein L9 [Mycoplasmopsis fermentans]ADN69232.1 predicted rplI [Mycoplasmopsis fermentans JER]
MKVILIKDCDKGKANIIIEVSAGYGNNFLIAKGFAVVYNDKTKKELEQRLSELTKNEMEKRSEALELKDQIEKLTLKYTLDAHIDNNGNLIAHGAVSTKDIVKDLVQNGYKLDKYAVQKVHLVSNGLHDIDVILYKDIIAKLKVEVIINAK